MAYPLIDQTEVGDASICAFKVWWKSGGHLNQTKVSMYNFFPC